MILAPFVEESTCGFHGASRDRSRTGSRLLGLYGCRIPNNNGISSLRFGYCTMYATHMTRYLMYPKGHVPQKRVSFLDVKFFCQHSFVLGTRWLSLSLSWNRSEYCSSLSQPHQQQQHETFLVFVPWSGRSYFHAGFGSESIHGI